MFGHYSSGRRIVVEDRDGERKGLPNAVTQITGRFHRQGRPRSRKYLRPTSAFCILKTKFPFFSVSYRKQTQFTPLTPSYPACEGTVLHHAQRHIQDRNFQLQSGLFLSGISFIFSRIRAKTGSLENPPQTPQKPLENSQKPSKNPSFNPANSPGLLWY